MTSHAYDYLLNRLNNEMHEGNMHGTIRDVGRMAGGLVGSGDMPETDLQALGEHAESLAINWREAAIKWAEAVEYGRREPLKWDAVPRKADKVIDWNDEIGGNYQIVDPDWVEPVDVVEPDAWDPMKEAADYLSTLFSAEEFVGYCVDASPRKDEKTGKLKYSPASRGVYSRTAGELISQLAHYGEMANVFGDTHPDAGAWIRFNPLDGQGVKNTNVTDFRYALVESDSVPVEQQRAIYEELELPVALLVHSGRRSLHAIVKIDADSLPEYKRRVGLLFDVCEKNGLKIDRQNSNPSRLSRLPGVMRGEQKQYIVARASGKATWAEWEDWIEAINDNLPEPECLAAEWDRIPDLSPPMIDGILRQGHKMLVSGPSKAGKSFLLIQMCIAIAEGLRWLKWRCTKGRVLYVNLELDRASCLNRFRDVYKALGLTPDNLANIDIWNLRGQAVPMDRLAPKLIRRAQKKGYAAVVIDPIYKVITGDENAADKMAYFCNQFDKVCHDLSAAVIYCHHHSKGAQGGKRSMDRASGSGVFARDPDALLDLIELSISDDLRKSMEQQAVCEYLASELDSRAPGWRDFTPDDDTKSEAKMMEAANRILGGAFLTHVHPGIFRVRERIKLQSAWRIEGTFREFPLSSPVNCWFDYPIHRLDADGGVLMDASPVGDEPFQRRGTQAAKKQTSKQQRERAKAILDAYKALGGGEVKLTDIAARLDVKLETMRSQVKGTAGFSIAKGFVTYSADDAARIKAAACRPCEDAACENEAPQETDPF